MRDLVKKFDSNQWVTWAICFLALLAINWRTLTLPPYWDALVGLYNQSVWLESHNFDLGQLQQEPGYNAGGPNVRPHNLVCLVVAVLYRFFSPSTVFLIAHLVVIGSAALIFTLFYGLLRRYLSGPESLLWCIAATVNPIFLGQTASIYLEIPLAVMVAGFLALVIREKYVTATAIGIVGFFVKPTFFLSGIAVSVWIAFRVLRSRYSSEDRFDKRMLILLILPFLHVPLAFFKSAGNAAGPTLVMPPWSELTRRASHYFPDQTLLLCFCLILSLVCLLRVRRRPFQQGWLNLTLLLSITVYGTWAFLSLYYHPLCRYTTMTVFPLMACAGLFCTQGFGKRFSLAVAALFVGWGILNSHGALLPELSDAKARSGDELERSCEFLIDQKACLELCGLLEAKCRDTVVVAKYPFLQMLTMPELGYVSTPLPDVRGLGWIPTYTTCRSLLSASLTRKVTCIYSPTAFETSLVPPMAPAPDSRGPFLFHDQSLPGDLIAYQLTRTETLQKFVVRVSLVLGVAAFEQGKFAEALKHFEEVLAVDSDQPLAHAILGVIYFRTDLSRAVFHSEQAVRLAPGNPIAHYRLALAYLEQRQFKNAKLQFLNTLKYEPNFREARIGLRKLLVDHPELREN